jgi:hypothetical protein
MGRRPWTTRLTVEECHSVDIAQLVRADAFKADPQTLSSVTSNDSHGKLVWGVTFRIFPDRSGAMAIHFYHPIQACSGNPAWIRQQIVQITTTKCNFGGVRRWFKCSLVKDGHLCKRRVRTLYSTPREQLFGCRECHNLTYRSAQTHDKRIGLLLKLPIEQFNKALATGTLRQRLLAVRASTARLLRMQRTAERFRKRRRNSRAQAVRAKAHVMAIPGHADAV